METEIEAKWLDIKPDEIRDKLKALGASLQYPETNMRRKVFDFDDNRLEKKGGWIRVRDEGDKVTLSYKQLNDRTLHGTKEVTVVVDDFDKAITLMQDIGLICKAYQETIREKWTFGEAEITIDTWPWIPTLIEIETPDEKELKSLANMLDLKWSNALFGSVENAYMKYYDVTEKEVDSWETITFSPVPDWLESSRKKS